MQIEFKVDESGTVHKIVTADPVVTDTVIDPFGYDAEAANLAMANTDDQNLIDKRTADIATRQAQIDNIKVQKAQAMAIPAVQEILTRQLTPTPNETPPSVPALPLSPDGSDTVDNKVPAVDETAPVVVDTPAADGQPAELKP